jgi:hypothetical protein
MDIKRLPDMCAVGPTERWLEHAAWRFSQDIANHQELYTGISGSFIREYATHAVRDFIVDEINVKLGWDTQLRVYPILDTILGIGNTREEGAWPRGELVFVEKSTLPSIRFVTSFPEMEQPIDLRQLNYLELAKSLAKVDGALHICKDLKLHACACLLDGRSIPGEDRARGARFNSALRFTTEYRNLIVVVVSSDRPVSTIQEGIKISAQCQWRPVSACTVRHQTLEEWVSE